MNPLLGSRSWENSVRIDQHSIVSSWPSNLYRKMSREETREATLLGICKSLLRNRKVIRKKKILAWRSRVKLDCNTKKMAYLHLRAVVVKIVTLQGRKITRISKITMTVMNLIMRR